VSFVGGQPIMSVPSDIISFDRATIFCAFGGPRNYGHFILDCLTALLAIDQIGLTEEYQPIVPKDLKQWHHDLLDRMKPRGPLIEVSQPVVYVGDLIYASPMARYLSYAGTLLLDLKKRMTTEDITINDRWIYFSRLGDKKRELVNEATLEVALRERGFAIVKPEVLSVRQQIELMSQTSIVVGAVGAAFANCLFMPRGAKIIEIQPSNYLSSFTRAMCDVLEMEWDPFFCESPLDEHKLLIEGQQRHGSFSFQIELAEFLSFLDEIVSPRSAPISVR
jgi:capsular polysaccharide biosynthesis protein